MIKKTPDNIEELKRMANNQASWRDRIKAVNALKNYDCQQSRDILARLAIHDIVFKVKEAAFRACQSLGVTKNGKPIRLQKKKKGNLIPQIHKKLTVVRNALPEEFTLEEFKDEFKKRYPAAYDAYEGDKGKLFDKWLNNVIPSLPKRKDS